ncbi:hypothetical protein DPMN_129228 [Dreissena polymorpha]|uniref:Uncharacterized protein n=1 Tax=Dreissena polymorpha TaxID=45954 RepID=A0A9D4H8N8_DREPO|nr:hypothetical protein DPMN_129228 [Dreissena polymorpha]
MSISLLKERSHLAIDTASVKTINCRAIRKFGKTSPYDTMKEISLKGFDGKASPLVVTGLILVEQFFAFYSVS